MSDTNSIIPDDDKSIGSSIDSATKLKKVDRLEIESTGSSSQFLWAFHGFDSPPDAPINDATVDMSKFADTEEDIFEDGLSAITADEYVRMRLIPTLAEFTLKAPNLSTSVYAVKLIGIILSVGSSVIA
jgi:hypothetical protein